MVFDSFRSTVTSRNVVSRKEERVRIHDMSINWKKYNRRRSEILIGPEILAIWAGKRGVQLERVTAGKRIT